jgi:nitrous oxidase accessory protein NosD
MNQAVIKDCDVGLTFDNLPLKNILVEGIEFICTENGVWSLSENKSVFLRNNVFRTGSTAIHLYARSSDWSITYNLIETFGDGIEVIGAERIIIANNHITGKTGVTMQMSSDIQVRENIIHASYQGIHLLAGAWRNLVEMNTILAGKTGITMEACTETKVRENIIHAAFEGIKLLRLAWRNLVELNTILGVSQSGIMLEPGASDNQILSNTITCAPNANCLTIEAIPKVAEQNTITGNLP